MKLKLSEYQAIFYVSNLTYKFMHTKEIYVYQMIFFTLLIVYAIIYYFYITKAEKKFFESIYNKTEFLFITIFI